MHSPTAIITGASTGIGKSLALVLAREGYDLGLTARRQDLLLDLRKEIAGRYPKRRVFISPADVASEVNLQAAMKELMTQLGRLDLMIANAGIGFPTPAWKNNWNEIKQILDANVMGAIHSLELAKEKMLEQKSGRAGAATSGVATGGAGAATSGVSGGQASATGHLVGISSVAGFRGLPTSSAYCTSKAALTTYLESIRIDLKRLGIAVTSIHPGFIETKMTEKNSYMPFLLSSEDAAEKIVRAIRRKKARFIFPWQMKLLISIMRALPDSVFDWGMSLKKQKGVFEDR